MNKELEPIVFRIRLIFADDLMNGVTTIGGAGWLNKPEQAEAWAAIPSLPSESKSVFMADLLDEQGDIVDDKQVSAETCETLMGKPISELIAEGRQGTCYTLGDYKAQHPELFSQATA